MVSTIDIKSVGPIDRLRIPVPKGGGVVVLKGRNGAGKSYALAGVQGLISPSARKVLRAMDGVSAGTVDGMGVTLRLGRANTARGELECETLDAACDPSVLVDPGIKDPVAADSKRLATVIRLARVKITADQWGKLFDKLDQYRETIDLDALSGDDPVVTADRIRRRLHELALKVEKLAQSAEAEADALRRQAGEIDLAAPTDEMTLAKCCDAAAERLIVATQQQHAAQEAKRALDAARLRMREIEAGYEGPGIAEAQAAETEARGVADQAMALVRAAEQALNDARRQVVGANEALKAAITVRQAAESHEKTIASTRAVLAKTVPEAPADDVIAQLTSERNLAREALAYAKQVNAAKRTLDKADELKERAVEKLEEAEQLREIARSTDSVLERALEDAGFTSIRVQDGRLCVPSSRGGGSEPYSELSHGERWALALDLAARGIGTGGLLTVEQEAWESLDPDNREHVAELARERGLVILTAEAADGDLRAEEFEPEAALVA